MKVVIIGAEQLAELAALEGVAEAVFGRGTRQPGWFRRKLIREGVEPRLSSLVVEVPAHLPLAPAQVRGYALLGRAPSLGAVARGAGLGLVAGLRGQKIGRALLEHASGRARATGCEAVEFLAEPRRLGWYRSRGFVTIAEQLTLLALGTGEPDAAPRAQPPPAELGRPLWSWIPEVWARTPAAERLFLTLDGARFWLTREGRAWLVHRCEADEPEAVERSPELLVGRIAALRRLLSPTTPLLLYPCPAASPWVDALREAGFDAAQRSFVVRRSTDPSA